MNNVTVPKLCDVIGRRTFLLMIEILFSVGYAILVNLECRPLSVEVITELFVILAFDYITLFEK